MTSKVCGGCKQEKDLNLFCLDSSKQDGKHSVCRECKRIYDENRWPETVQRRYGIPSTQYSDMLLAQDNKCAICKSSSSKHTRNLRLSVDHCHKTGKVRGLLCHNCNVGLGGFEDSEQTLKSAIKYLRVYH